MKRIVVYGLADGLGGVETIVLSLMEELIDRFNFTIVLSGKNRCCYLHRLPKGVQVVYVTAWGANPKKFKTEFCNILNECECDFVWLNACVTSNRELISAIKLAKRQVRLITHSHGTNYESDGALKTIIIKILHKFNRKLYNDTASLKWACSHKAAEWFYGKKNCRDVTIINNGIYTSRYKYDTAMRTKMRKQFDCENSFVCLHIGRLTPVKNQSFLLKVFAEICKRKQNAFLLIAGTGDLGVKLKEEAAALGIDNKVRFLGLYNNVFELYNMSDAFLLPSLHEGMPLTLVEAQCSGLHCFVSSSISQEVKLTRFLSFLSISESPVVWAEKIVSQQYEHQRDFGKLEIVKAGFDIETISDNVATMITNVH